MSNTVPPQDEYLSLPDDAAPRPPWTRRRVALWVSGIVAMGMALAIVFVPVPYVVQRPGPTFDTLGSVDGQALIQIDGAKTYPSSGELRLVTVSVSGGPGYPVSAANLLVAWASGQDAVKPVESVYPPEQTKEEAAQVSQAQMTTSQENASVAALTELGYDIPTKLKVAGTAPGGPAEGKLEADDIIVSLNGEKVATYADLVDKLGTIDGGTTVTLGIERGGQPQDIEIVTASSPDGKSLLGVYINPEFTLPFDVKVGIENVGGPSAGMMFALGIIDKLTPEDEVNGQHIAGTGTMDLLGNVGAIGGIQQKMHGAVSDGATWFLAPESNCNEVVGHIPAGLHVASVSTLHEAREAMIAIGAGKGDSLKTCSAS